VLYYHFSHLNGHEFSLRFSSVSSSNPLYPRETLNGGITVLHLTHVLWLRPIVLLLLYLDFYPWLLSSLLSFPQSFCGMGTFHVLNSEWKTVPNISWEILTVQVSMSLEDQHAIITLVLWLLFVLEVNTDVSGNVWV